MALQRTRRPRCRSGRSLCSLGSPLNARPLGPAVRISGVTALALTVLGASLSCRVVPNVAVAHQLRSIARKGVGTQLRLSDVTDFKWSKFVWLEPYTRRQTAEAALGFDWPDYDRWGLEKADHFSLIVFADGGSVVRVEQLDRGDGEFVPEASGNPYSPSAAVFEVVERQKTKLFARRTTGGA